MQARDWCFTWNNPDGVPDPDLLPGCKYMVAQMEIGESGTLHYQGFLQMERSVRIARLKEWLPSAHFEKRRGTSDEARAYCMKEGRLEDPIEWGQYTTQGQRSDLLLIKRKLDQGTRLVDILEDEACFSTVLRNHRALQWYQSVKKRVAAPITEVVVIVGPTGTGKTTYAKQFRTTWFALDPMTTWWDGYTDEKCVILDEFIGKGLSMEAFNMLVDGTRVLMPIKGGYVQSNADCLVITSNLMPEKWWPTAYLDAFKRRVTRWIAMRTMGDPEEFEDYYSFERCIFGLTVQH